ncbi:MAG: HAMP domain-containing histidine kinase [Clostridia bacterium]|nr:HAMP domain-containing histidine kinase [Clostridia bacterium]
MGRTFRFGIAGKMAVYLIITLLIFAIVIGVAFSLLFRRHAESIYVENMERTAYSIRDMMAALAKHQGSIIIGDYPSTPGGTDEFGSDSGGGFQLSRETFSRLVSGLTDSTVWMVAPNSQGDSFDMLFLLPQDGTKHYNDTNFSNLQGDIQTFIRHIYQGKEGNTTLFSTLMGKRTLTVGVPILREDSSVMGVVLIHKASSVITETFQGGLWVLMMSILMAMLIGCGCLAIVVRKFSKPLVKINQTALLISEGDYTAQSNVRSDDEVGMLAETIDDMGKKLQAAGEESAHLMQLRQEFVANISHELRTPVTVMRGSLEALCDHVVTEPEMVEKYHGELLKESMYMQRLVNDLLDLSRLQNAGFSMNIQRFNLFDCVSDSVRSGRRVADNKRLAVDFEYDTIEQVYEGDYDRIRQMLLIVLDNAIKFTSDIKNSVRVTFKQGTVSITNVGPGISEKELPYVFERFYKSRSETNKNGTGLGLAIAKQIAIRHGIGISVRSIPGGETTFWFDFNLHQKNS